LTPNEQKLTVKVTAADITNGQRCRASYCPVALALSRATGGVLATVSGRALLVGDLGARTPQRVKAFIHLFDTKGRASVAPFQFTVTLREGGDL
jgi:hypothetical protein